MVSCFGPRPAIVSGLLTTIGPLVRTIFPVMLKLIVSPAAAAATAARRLPTPLSALLVTTMVLALAWLAPSTMAPQSAQTECLGTRFIGYPPIVANGHRRVRRGRSVWRPVLLFLQANEPKPV